VIVDVVVDVDDNFRAGASCEAGIEARFRLNSFLRLQDLFPAQLTHFLFIEIIIGIDSHAHHVCIPDLTVFDTLCREVESTPEDAYKECEEEEPQKICSAFKFVLCNFWNLKLY